MADRQDLESYRRESLRYYLTIAIKAEEAAGTANNPAARDQFLRVAKAWRGLAEASERSP